MKYQTLFFLTLLLLFSFSCSSSKDKKQSKNKDSISTKQTLEQPNIIFFAVDDMNDFVNPLGHKQAITPNLDRLAEMGVTFSNAHAQIRIVLHLELVFGPDYNLLRPVVIEMRHTNMIIQI